jgi:methylmalonyl-CoA mutase N-terminal domain/subunit
MAAVLGGTQSLHTNSMDETLALPTEQAVQVALRTQQILAYETGVPNVIDPLGGSYYIESLTDELEKRATELIARIDDIGGAVAAVEQGFVQDEIERAAFDWQQQVERGERVIVGVNKYTVAAEQEIELQTIDPAAEQRQLARTAKLRAERNADVTAGALDRVREAARGTDNLLHPMRDALRVSCTIGEICGVLREEWGEHDRLAVR